MKYPLTSLASRRRTCRCRSVSHPTVPRNTFSQAYATATAITREIIYPQPILFSNPWIAWLSLPPLGRSLAILSYWVLITLLLTIGSIMHDAYYWERIAYRAAWISVTQVPLIYLLAGKVNVLGMTFGSSYTDVNWIHRWVSRTLLIIVTLHGGFFIGEWIRADFVRLELQMMPMVKYGLGAWAVLVWTNHSSLLPVRRMCYELFVLQHIASGVVFLWLLYKHIPSYARYNVWMAIAFLISGRVLRTCIFLFRNLGKGRIGYSAELRVLSSETVGGTILNVDFSWKAGQHILLSCPTLGPFEPHPFTISNVSDQGQGVSSRRLELIIRKRAGFTRKLYGRALRSRSNSYKVRALINGPYGNMPTWNTFETVVLISASTGASFTLPILESVLNDPCCVSRVDCIFLTRDGSDLGGYLSRIRSAASHPYSSNISLQIEIAITRNPFENKESEIEKSRFNPLVHSTEIEKESSTPAGSRPSITLQSLSSNTNATHNSIPTKEQDLELDTQSTEVRSESSSTKDNDILHYSKGRPNLADAIRVSIEASAGETSVVVCGGKSLTSTVRNAVASLSDERAVHKGTGAQGIHLHVEEFGY